MPDNKHYILQIAMLISVYICLTNTKENFLMAKRIFLLSLIQISSSYSRLFDEKIV